MIFGSTPKSKAVDNFSGIGVVKTSGKDQYDYLSSSVKGRPRKNQQSVDYTNEDFLQEIKPGNGRTGGPGSFIDHHKSSVVTEKQRAFDNMHFGNKVSTDAHQDQNAFAINLGPSVFNKNVKAMNT